MEKEQESIEWCANAMLETWWLEKQLEHTAKLAAQAGLDYTQELECCGCTCEETPEFAAWVRERNYIAKEEGLVKEGIRYEVCDTEIVDRWFATLPPERQQQMRVEWEALAQEEFISCRKW